MILHLYCVIDYADDTDLGSSPVCKNLPVIVLSELVNRTKCLCLPSVTTMTDPRTAELKAGSIVPNLPAEIESGAHCMVGSIVPGIGVPFARLKGIAY